MNRRTALLIAIGAALLLLCGLPIIGAISIEPAAAACSGPGGGASPGEIPTAGVGPLGKWTSEQTTNAAIIVAVGMDMKVPARGWVIAVATAMQESRLINLGNLGETNDHDSLWLFQQRPSMGWGTPAQIMDPQYASRKFYEKLVTVPNWQTIPLTRAAQAVQRSAFPSAYAKHEKDAEEVVAHVAKVGSIRDLAGGSLINCGNPGTISSGGWTQPVKANIVSGFRTADRPDHFGVDLGAPRYTAIRAAAAGKVVKAVCNATTGNCDVNGATWVGGCGWYVDIQHAGNIVTRYCHMIRKPDVQEGQTVTAGQVIGAVGSSGNSSGPHLHFEVHTNVAPAGYAGNNNAVDPAGFMRSAGSPLGAK